MEMYECSICKKKKGWKTDSTFPSKCDDNCGGEMKYIGKYCPICGKKLQKRYEGLVYRNFKCCMYFKLGKGWAYLIPRDNGLNYLYNKFDFDLKHFNNLKKWLRLKTEILERDERKCVICSSNIELNVHHIISRAEAPELTFDKENLMTLCKSCHKKIHTDDKYYFGGKND